MVKRMLLRDFLSGLFSDTGGMGRRGHVEEDDVGVEEKRPVARDLVDRIRFGGPKNPKAPTSVVQ